MATTAANVLIGACTVSIGEYVSNAGTATLVDAGHTSGPVSWPPEFANAEVISERQMGPIKVVPTGMKFKVTVPMLECQGANLRVALRQALANLSTGTNTSTLLIHNPVEQYHRITLAGPGPVGALARTITFWKCMVETAGEMQMAKGAAMVCSLVLTVLADDTITSTTTNGTYGKVVDA